MYLEKLQVRNRKMYIRSTPNVLKAFLTVNLTVLLIQQYDLHMGREWKMNGVDF